MNTESAVRYRALPVQLVRVEDGVFVRRGANRFKVAGVEAHVVLETIFAQLGAAEGELDAVYDSFDESLRESVRGIVDALMRNRVLVEAGSPEAEAAASGVERATDVFLWQVGASGGEARERLRTSEIAILGVNTISARLAAAAQACGFENVSVVDHPLMRNVRVSVDDPSAPVAWPQNAPSPIAWDDWDSDDVQVLVATSDFGGLETMREWNAVCVNEGTVFLPIVLQDMIGFIGPMVVPGHSPCFECLWARQNAHLENPTAQRATENAAFFGQTVDGSLAPMGSILGELGALELLKYHTDLYDSSAVGNHIEVDVLAPSVVRRKVLRVPRCAVCSGTVQRATRTPDKDVIMPGNE